MNQTLTAFQVENAEQADALRAAWQFVGELKGNRPRWLTYCGESGTGKTLLASGILRQVLRSGVDTCWAHWPTVVDRFRERDQEHYDMAHASDIAFVDDIAAEHQTPFDIAKLYALLESRIGKWTVITVNLFFDQIETKLDPRISSRMMRQGNEVFEFRITGDWCKTHATIAPERPLTKEQKFALREKELAPHHVSRLPEEKVEEMRKRLQSLANHLSTY